jgi:hypothetical protein
MFGQLQFRPTLQNFTLVITFARISSLPHQSQGNHRTTVGTDTLEGDYLPRFSGAIAQVLAGLVEHLSWSFFNLGYSSKGG